MSNSGLNQSGKLAGTSAMKALDPRFVYKDCTTIEAKIAPSLQREHNKNKYSTTINTKIAPSMQKEHNKDKYLAIKAKIILSKEKIPNDCAIKTKIAPQT